MDACCEWNQDSLRRGTVTGKSCLPSTVFFCDSGNIRQSDINEVVWDHSYSC